jgi:diguanylate cyclase (GGDEF)-like protein/PAS domain S-box-containing protein
MRQHDSSTQKTIAKRLTPLRVALLYAVFAALWIVVSGQLLSFAVVDAVFQGRIELAKGLFFVAVTSGLLYLLLKDWRGTEASTATMQDAGVRPRRLIPLFVALVLIVPLVGVTITTLYSSQIEREAYANLDAIAKLKAEQIENWLAERQGDSVMLMNSEGFIKSIEQFIQKPTAASRRAIQKPFDTLRTLYGYHTILLMDLNDQILFASGGELDNSVELQQLLRQSIATKQVLRGDFYRDEKENIHLDWVVPIFVADAHGEHAIASVVLRTTGQHFLFPLIQSWPTPSVSAESILVRQDGDSVLYINTLRHRANTALSLRLPLNQPELPAAIAVLSGKQGTAQGFDYRHVDVLSAYRPIKGTNWMLIAKIDHDEVLTPLHKLVLWVSLIAFVAVVAISIMLLIVWRRQQQVRNLMLWTQQAKLEAALASMSDAVYISDTEGRFIEFNEAFATFHKFSNKEECPKILAEYPNFIDAYSTSGEFLPLEQRPVPCALRGETATNVEFVLSRKDTNETWVGNFSYAPIRNNNGVIIGAVVTARDITDRKQAEEALRASEARWKFAIEGCGGGLWDWNVTDNTAFYSTFWKEMIGYSEDEIGIDLKEFEQRLHPEDKAAVFAVLQDCLEDKTPIYLSEYRFQCKDGSYKWMFDRGMVVERDQDNKPLRMIGTHIDISERKKAEAALRESAEKLRLFIHYSPSAIAMFDGDMRYIAVSHRWLIDYGLGEQELVGRSHYDIFPDLPEHWKELHRRSLAGAIEKCDKDSFPRADGSVEWVRWEMHPWLTSEGDIGGIIIFSELITERVEMEQALIASEKEFRLLAESMPQIVWIANSEGETIYLNQQWVNYTGLSLEESYGDNWSKPLYPDDLQRAWDAWQNAVNNHVVYSLESRLRRADGVYRWWLIRGVPLFDEHGNVYKWFGTCTDIHELKETEKSLRDSESRLQFILQTSHIGVWDLNLVDYTGHRTLEHGRIFGYESPLPAWNYQTFLKHILPEDKDQIDHLIKNALAAKTNWEFECRIRRADGEVRWIWGSGRYSLDEDTMPHMSGIVQDITERKKAEETIYELAYYDPLTHLPNRRLMLDRLKQALISRKLKSRYGAVLFIDLNDFKTLNDTKGHDIGDLLLIEIARHLQAAVHEDDTVARTGGNEFVVLIDALDIKTELAAVQAETVAKRILTAAINLSFDLQGYEYRCSACIGITLFHSHEISVDELVKQANMAMHQAKQIGKNTIRFFDPSVQAALEFRVQMEVWMRKALNEEYQLYYQLQIDEKSKVTGAEALIRWHHPEHGIISPAAFIPLAEQTGLILQIGQWVLKTACIQLKAWEHNQQTRHLILAVNVSAKQFNQPDFVEQVLTVLEQTGANPDKLKLELTESMLVTNVEDIIVKMNILRIKGVRFSLDDFGTGFSSLTYLKRLPLDQLKIDQSFVRDALTDPNDATIIRTIIALGQSLGMEVIAEGVETEAQRNFLVTHGCNQYQGYLFSKPLPLAEFEQLLRFK